MHSVLDATRQKRPPAMKKAHTTQLRYIHIYKIYNIVYMLYVCKSAAATKQPPTVLILIVKLLI